MSAKQDIASICLKLEKEYGVCDVADGLEKLGVPQAGFLADIMPRSKPGSTTRFVAPVSTVLFVPKDDKQPGLFNSEVPSSSNVPKDSHWTDNPTPGSVAIVKQPAGQFCAVIGDILATRLKVRGVKGILADGRVRDLSALRDLCEDGSFTAWSRATSVVTSGLETKPLAVDIPVHIGSVEIRSGDLIHIDEEEQGAVVVPQDKIEKLLEILPALAKADCARVEAVKSGSSVTEAFRNNPK